MLRDRRWEEDDPAATEADLELQINLPLREEKALIIPEIKKKLTENRSQKRIRVR